MIYFKTDGELVLLECYLYMEEVHMYSMLSSNQNTKRFALISKTL